MIPYILLVVTAFLLLPYSDALSQEASIKENIVKRSDEFNEYALTEYLFKRADIDKDQFLTKNEIYNFYRHDIKWPFKKAADMSIKLMKVGDTNKDEKLDFTETIIAFFKISDKIPERKK